MSQNTSCVVQRQTEKRIHYLRSYKSNQGTQGKQDAIEIYQVYRVLSYDSSYYNYIIISELVSLE